MRLAIATATTAAAAAAAACANGLALVARGLVLHSPQLRSQQRRLRFSTDTGINATAQSRKLCYQLGCAETLTCGEMGMKTPPTCASCSISNTCCTQNPARHDETHNKLHKGLPGRRALVAAASARNRRRQLPPLSPQEQQHSRKQKQSRRCCAAA